MCGEIPVKSGYETMLKLAADQDRIDNVTDWSSLYDFENSTSEEHYWRINYWL